MLGLKGVYQQIGPLGVVDPLSDAQDVSLHTPREPVPEVETWALFSEEHSHAVEQKLCGDEHSASDFLHSFTAFGR
mgnify:CR=1 FL=1